MHTAYRCADLVVWVHLLQKYIFFQILEDNILILSKNFQKDAK